MERTSDVHRLYLVCTQPELGFDQSFASVPRIRNVGSAEVRRLPMCSPFRCKPNISRQSRRIEHRADFFVSLPLWILTTRETDVTVPGGQYSRARRQDGHMEFLDYGRDYAVRFRILQFLGASNVLTRTACCQGSPDIRLRSSKPDMAAGILVREHPAGALHADGVFLCAGGAWIRFIFVSFSLIRTFLLGHQTTFDRPAAIGGTAAQTTQSDDPEKIANIEIEKKFPSVDENEIESEESAPSSPNGSAQRSRSTSQPKPSYLSQLKVWNGTFSDEPLWKLVMRPLPFMCSPVVRVFICSARCRVVHSNCRSNRPSFCF